MLVILNHKPTFFRFCSVGNLGSQTNFFRYSTLGSVEFLLRSILLQPCKLPLLWVKLDSFVFLIISKFAVTVPSVSDRSVLAYEVSHEVASGSGDTGLNSKVDAEGGGWGCSRDLLGIICKCVLLLSLRIEPLHAEISIPMTQPIACQVTVTKYWFPLLCPSSERWSWRNSLKIHLVTSSGPALTRIA